MIKRMNSGSKREAAVIIIFLLGVLLFSWWNFYGSLIYYQVEDLRQQLELTRAETKQFAAITHQGEAIEAEWSRWQKKKALLEENVPRQKELPFVLVSLEEKLNLLAGSVYTFQVGATTVHESYSSTRINLGITDRPARMQSLLQQIDEIPYLLTFNSINWSQTGEDDVRLDLVLQLILINQPAVEIKPETLFPAAVDQQ